MTEQDQNQDQNRIDPEKKALLTSALRSGRFNQGTSRLTTLFNKTRERNHCCLGVSCVIAIENGLSLDIEVGPTLPYSPELSFITYDDARITLPHRAQKWYGFDSDMPMIPIKPLDSDDFPVSLGHLNDDKFTFPQIADLIDYFF